MYSFTLYASFSELHRRKCNVLAISSQGETSLGSFTGTSIDEESGKRVTKTIRPALTIFSSHYYLLHPSQCPHR